MTDQTKQILDVLSGIIGDLNEMADEWNAKVSKAEGGAYQSLYYSAYAAGVLGACLKVCERKEMILKTEQRKLTGSSRGVLIDEIDEMLEMLNK